MELSFVTVTFDLRWHWKSYWIHKIFKKMSRMIILKNLVENKFLKLFLKLECLHHNYRVLTHVCLSVELSVFEQDNSRMLCPRIMKFGYNIEYDNISNRFDIGHGWAKVKVTKFFLLPQNKLSNIITKVDTSHELKFCRNVQCIRRS